MIGIDAISWVEWQHTGLLLVSLGQVWLPLLLTIILLCCSALISGSEVAYFSLSHADRTWLEQEESTDAQRVLNLLSRPQYLLATILIANNFINIAIVILSTFVLAAVVTPDTAIAWGNAFVGAVGLESTLSGELVGKGVQFFIEVVLVTFLLVLFGEVAPKIYAKFNNLKLSLVMSKTLLLLRRAFWAFSTVLVRSTSMIQERLVARRQRSDVISMEDIDKAIDMTMQDAKAKKQEVNMLKSIVLFNNTTVKQITRARVDVTAFDFRMSFEEVLAEVREHSYSRYPVYQEDFDNVIGILYTKDLLPHLDDLDFEWQELIRTDVLYIHESHKISDLLREIQEERVHMAIVVDEYGGSQGIATLEDILEEVVGEIRDEYDDQVEIEYKKLAPDIYLFEGKTLINDVCRVLSLNIDTFDEVRGDSDSIAGVMLERLGRMPKQDEEIVVHNYKLKAEKVTPRRVEQVRLELLPEREAVVV